jgi:hypothetical protein
MIPKVLLTFSTFQKHRVRALLIGGQACILYGAAEFSRDSDFIILCSEANLRRVRAALNELQAEQIYVPPLRASFLRRGHACHFRCHAPGLGGLRVDLMAKMRGCDDFPRLWRRRHTVRLPDGETVHLLGLRDLVQSKKTQRDKDWLMLRRLVDSDVFFHMQKPRRSQVRWWLLECRTPDRLIEFVREYPSLADGCAALRPLLRFALIADTRALEDALRQEERIERERDRKYWWPLRKELERLRRQRRMR